MIPLFCCHFCAAGANPGRNFAGKKTLTNSYDRENLLAINFR
ncbi:hypothetical protein HMPREF3220_00098 [Citrobacter koseri]|nr:hypothetical protein HMPREF3220_00098 [Citrobacter koseri]